MSNFFIIFDLPEADEQDYDDIYCWAHASGGHHYLKLRSGGWGALPGHCLLMPYRTDDPKEARELFLDDLMTQFKTRPVRFCVIRGERAAFAEPSDNVPEYVRTRRTAAQEHERRKLKRQGAAPPVAKQ